MPPFDPLWFFFGFAACIILNAVILLFVLLTSTGDEEPDDDSLSFCYWRRGVAPPQGWEVADDFAGTHHAEYAILLRKGSNDWGSKQRKAAENAWRRRRPRLAATSRASMTALQAKASTRRCCAS